MYNKLFTKILDSSIWLESTTTRIVWLTLIAAMDETGFAQFASIANVAHRARVSVDDAELALRTLQNPDEQSSDPSNDGRRIERVPGGYLVLNAEKHRLMVTRAVMQEHTRERVRKHREKQSVTLGNAPSVTVTHGNASVTPGNASEAEAEARSETKAEVKAEARSETPVPQQRGSTHTPRAQKTALVGDERFQRFWAVYPNKKGKDDALKAWTKRHPSEALTEIILAAVESQKSWPEWTKDGGRYIPHPATWLNRGSWDDEPAQPQVSAVSDLGRQNAANAERALELMEARDAGK